MERPLGQATHTKDRLREKFTYEVIETYFAIASGELGYRVAMFEK